MGCLEMRREVGGRRDFSANDGRDEALCVHDNLDLSVDSKQSGALPEDGRQRAVGEDGDRVLRRQHRQRQLDQRLVDNYRLLSYALTAYGLGDQVDNKALVTQVLEGGVSSSKALANTLSNPNWAKFAAAFNFAADGASSISTSSAISTTNRLRRAAARKPGGPAGRRRPARALFPARRADDHLVLQCARRREPARGVSDHLRRDAQTNGSIDANAAIVSRLMPMSD